jgi:hypothetical protein
MIPKLVPRYSEDMLIFHPVITLTRPFIICGHSPMSATIEADLRSIQTQPLEVSMK